MFLYIKKRSFTITEIKNTSLVDRRNRNTLAINRVAVKWQSPAASTIFRQSNGDVPRTSARMCRHECKHIRSVPGERKTRHTLARVEKPGDKCPENSGRERQEWCVEDFIRSATCALRVYLARLKYR